jgi:hypothetical protein
VKEAASSNRSFALRQTRIHPSPTGMLWQASFYYPKTAVDTGWQCIPQQRSDWHLWH